MAADGRYHTQHAIAVTDGLGKLGWQALPGSRGKALEVETAEHTRLTDIPAHARQDEAGILLHDRQLLLHEKALLVAEQHLGCAEHQNQADDHGHHEFHQTDAPLRP